MNMSIKEDNLYTGPEAQARVIAGINKVCDAVKTTLGAKGTNSLIERFENPGHIVTNDGISIIQSIVLKDPLENIGANLVKETSGRHNKQSGDGSTTTSVLLQAILKEATSVKTSPIELMRSLNEALPVVLDAIDRQTKTIPVEEVGRVAAISAEDPSIGALIQEVYTQIGKDGIIYPDISKTFNDHYTIGKGVKIEDAGYISPYMADLDDSGTFKKSVSWKNPHILVTKQKLSSATELNALAAHLFSKEVKELVVFADDIEGAVIPDLVRTRAERGFRIVVIKMPVLWKDYWFTDIAKMTGATIIDPALGISFKTMKPEHLGTVENILIDKDDTYLDGIQDVSAHIQELEADGSDDAKLRIARLNTKTARLFVGAHSDAMLSYRRLKIEDAINSAWLALQYGIVAGGGVALMNIATTLPDTPGGKILNKALISPMAQILINAGATGETWTPGTIDNTEGYDAKAGKHVDMLDAGIVDAASVVKSAITNAISVASTVLTARVIVTLPKPEGQLPNVPTI